MRNNIYPCMVMKKAVEFMTVVRDGENLTEGRREEGEERKKRSD